MLVVIAIIGILAGIVFKLFSMVSRRGEIAKCVQELELMSHALSEFYAEYGQYPPAGGMKYEYENTTLQNPVFCNIYLPQNTDWADDTLFAYGGLVSWLWPRKPGALADDYPLMPGSSIQHENNIQCIPDSSRDEAAKQRWAVFLREIVLTEGEAPHTDNEVESEGDVVSWPYTNDTLSVADPWGTEYQYRSLAPHLSYDLWSYGPDGTNSQDDIHHTGWDE